MMIDAGAKIVDAVVAVGKSHAPYASNYRARIDRQTAGTGIPPRRSARNGYRRLRVDGHESRSGHGWETG